MIGTIETYPQAHSPDFPLDTLKAFVGSPSSMRIRNVPKKVGSWQITKVYVEVVYPDNTSQTADCTLVGGVWVCTIAGSSTAGTLTQGYTVYADGTDENGNAVTGYILGKGDVVIMQASSTPKPEPATIFVRLKDDGTDAEEGAIFPTEDGYAVQQNGEMHLLGRPFDQITAYVDTQVSSKAEISEVETVAEDVEDLSNSLSNYYTKSETSSAAEINSSFEAVQAAITEVDNSLSDYYLKNETSSKVEIQNALDTKQPVGDYALTSQIPTVVSQLENDAGYLTEHQSLSDYYTKSETSSGVELNTMFETKADLSSTIGKALISQKLVGDVDDEHSTRVVVDEYDNVILQKYTTGWYVSKIEVSIGTATDYTETNEYYAYLTDVRLDTEAGRLYFTTVAQDKQRNLYPYKMSSSTPDYSTGEFIITIGWTTTQAGGQAIYLHLTITNAETPVWVDVARLVPDSSKYSGLLDTQITPNGQFVTPTQVKPYNGILGYANRAQGSLFMFGRSSPTTPDENHFVTIDYNVGKLCFVGSSYYPWQLSMYDGTTFDPPLQMNYGYSSTIAYKYNGRIRNLYVNSNCWVAIQTVDARNTKPYYIIAVEDENGSIIPDTNLYITGVAHPITFSTNKLSIETIDGVAGNITCTRQSTGTYQTELNYFAYEADLSAKADLSALATKADISALTTKADLSSLDDKRSVFDYNVYGDPLATGDMKFKFKAVGKGGTHQTTEGTMTIDPSNPTLTWVWTDGQANCSIEYTGESYVFIYNYLSDGLNQFNGQFTMSITEPKWSCEYADGVFDFIIVSSKGTIATQEWVEEQLPTKTSDLTNDSGFITLAQVPTPSYIEDSVGNRINANLSCIYIDDTAWEVTDPSSNKYVLEYVGFIQSYHTWECVVPENIKLVLTYSNDWLLQVYTWQEVGPGGDYDWVLVITGSYNGDSDITTIPYFVNATTAYNYSAQRPVTKHLTLATKEYVDSRLSALEARIAALEGN